MNMSISVIVQEEGKDKKVSSSILDNKTALFIEKLKAFYEEQGVYTSYSEIIRDIIESAILSLEESAEKEKGDDCEVKPTT